jgi:hypothetical protein
MDITCRWCRAARLLDRKQANHQEPRIQVSYLAITVAFFIGAHSLTTATTALAQNRSSPPLARHTVPRNPLL